MGKDKYENEDLIKYGHPEDVWFHVDDLSSAHVYLRMKLDMTLDDISEELLLDCATLVKANSIEGCKKSSVYVIYTRWKNLKKTNNMVDGEVGFYRPENKRRIHVEKNKPIVNALNKTKVTRFPNLFEEQQERSAEIRGQEKARKRAEIKEKKLEQQQKKTEKELYSYDRIMKSDNMISNSEIVGTVDSSAANAYEEDFF